MCHFLLDSVASFRNARQGHRQFPLDWDLAEESLGRGPLGSGYPAVGAEIAADGWKGKDGVRTAQREPNRFFSCSVQDIFENPGGALRREAARAGDGSFCRSWLRYAVDRSDDILCPRRQRRNAISFNRSRATIDIDDRRSLDSRADL